MTKRAKKKKNRIFKVFVTLVASVFILLVVLFSILSTSFVKPHIEKAVSDAAGTEIKLNGNIGLGLAGFMPALSVEDIHVVEQDIRVGNLEFAPAPTKAFDKSIWRFFIDVDRLNVQGTDFGNYSATVDAYTSGVRIPKLLGNMGPARLDGSMKYVDGQFALQGTLTKMPYEKLAKSMNGDFDLEMDLKGTGSTVDQVLPTLQGNLLLIGGKAGMKSTALKLWTTDFLQILFSGQKTELELRCMVADLTVDKGVATTKALFMDSDQMALIGKGRVDLGRQFVNIKLTPRPKGPTLVNLATPVRLKGPFNNISAIPDAKEVAKTIGGALLSGANPAAAFLTMMKNSSADKDICSQYLDRRK